MVHTGIWGLGIVWGMGGGGDHSRFGGGAGMVCAWFSSYPGTCGGGRVISTGMTRGPGGGACSGLGFLLNIALNLSNLPCFAG